MPHLICSRGPTFSSQLPTPHPTPPPPPAIFGFLLCPPSSVTLWATLECCVCFSLPRNSGFRGTAEVRRLLTSKPFLTPEIKIPFSACQAQGDQCRSQLHSCKGRMLAGHTACLSTWCLALNLASSRKTKAAGASLCSLDMVPSECSVCLSEPRRQGRGGCSRLPW